MTFGVDRAASAGLIGLSVERAFLDFQMTGVGDRLCNINQQKVVDKHVGVGGQCRRRPVLLAVAHIPFGQAVLQALKKQRAKLFIDRERRLLVPEIAKIVRTLQSGIVQAHIGLLGTANPIDAWRLVSDKCAGPGNRHRFGDHREQRSLAGIKHALRVEFDDDAQHVVVEEQILKLLQTRGN